LRKIARKTTPIVVIAAVLVAAAGYVLWAYEDGQPPFCSGYPPGGNCPGNYSYTFQISVNYRGPWQFTYYGYHTVGAPANPYSGVGNYTGGNFRGTGSVEENVTLSGPNTEGLTLCVQAQKLDSSNSPMTIGSNSTSVPYGKAGWCSSVAP
jgi:hypothetical protein